MRNANTIWRYNDYMVVLNSKEYRIYKEHLSDISSWVDHKGYIGEHLVTFDRKIAYNLFTDYPARFSDDQLELFDKEHPFWAEYFASRRVITNE